MSSSLLRIAVVQLNPKLGQVQANILRARELCSKLQPNTLDLVCFPEMAFSGYVFDDAAAITPFLEEPHIGPTSLFCADLAKKLRCYVVAGYPEKLTPTEKAEPIEDPDKSCEHPVGANSAIMYGRDGELIGKYRKVNLFETDMTWAKPGNTFGSFPLPPPLRNLTLGICNDLNPERGKSWSLEDGPYELAAHTLQTNSDLLILLNSWLESPTEHDDDDDNDWGTLQYWAARLRPLWVQNRGVPQPTPRDTFVVACNRSGHENGKTFAGTSAIFKFTKGSSKPVLLDMMTKGEEGVKVFHVPI